MTNKMTEAIDLVLESMFTPDDKLRSEALNLCCYPELMEVRDKTIGFLTKLRQDQITL